jgi:hypothetical protein
MNVQAPKIGTAGFKPLKELHRERFWTLHLWSFKRYHSQTNQPSLTIKSIEK